MKRLTLLLLLALAAAPVGGGGSLDFDGSNDEVDFNDIDAWAGSTELSVAVILETDSTGEAWLFAQWSNNTAYRAWSMTVNWQGGKYEFAVVDEDGSGGDCGIISTDSYVATGVWTCVVGTWKANGAPCDDFNLYGLKAGDESISDIEGTKYDYASTTQVYNPAGDVCFGIQGSQANCANGAKDFDGRLHSGQVWTRKITQAEAEEACRCPGSVADNLVFHAWLNDTTSYDTVGGVAGTATGATESTDAPPFVQSCEGPQ